MFNLIQQLFIVLSSFSISLATNFSLFMMSLDLKPVNLKYCPVMISLDKFSWSCNVSSPGICVPKETKHINVKVFNIKMNKNEAKSMAKLKIFRMIVNANSVVLHLIQTKNRMTKRVNVAVKIIISAKMIIVRLSANIFMRIANIQTVSLILQWSCLMELYLLLILYQQKWQILYKQIYH